MTALQNLSGRPVSSQTPAALADLIADIVVRVSASTGRLAA